jgi:hypothetical protein
MSIMKQNTIIKLENVHVNLKSNVETIKVLKRNKSKYFG